ncbi:hypothetical protein ACFVX6_32375 [Streptomyces sp. NPDC058289]
MGGTDAPAVSIGKPDLGWDSTPNDLGWDSTTASTNDLGWD